MQRGFKAWTENASTRYRQELGIVPEAPLSPYALAHHLKVQVLSPEKIDGVSEGALRRLLREDSSSWSGITLCLPSRIGVIINSAHSAARQSSDLMHELAHVILDHKAARVDVSKSGHLLLSTHDKAQEEEASWLSGALLLPRVALLHIRKRRLELEEAMQEYGVSMEMMNWRLRVTGVDTQMRRSRSARAT